MTKQKLNPHMTRALFDPQSINVEKRTVEVVFATDKLTRMIDWVNYRWIEESLSMNPDHIRKERLDAGAPVLDNHNRYAGAKGQLGIVDSYSFSGGQARATLRFSKRADVEPIWQDVQDGILRGISVGYRVHKYEDMNPNRKADEIPQMRAIDWEPMEISIAPVQADPGSAVRNIEGQEPNEVTLITTRTENGDIPAPVVVADPVNPENNLENNRNMPNTVDPITEPTPVDTEAVRQAAIKAERERSKDIMNAVRSAKLPETFATKLIEDGTSIDAARALIIEEFAKNDPNSSQRNTVTVGVEDVTKRRNAIENALILRANPNFKMTDDQKASARDFRGMNMIRMAEEVISLNGGSVRGLSQREVAVAALGIDDSSVRSAGMHSTTDFPIILGNTINRVLRAEYELASDTFAEWTRETTATDFREMTKAQFGEVGAFQKVLEGGEYKATSLSEAKESYKIEKFGQMINFTWEMLINDDLGAFSRIPSKIAAAARRLKADTIYGILSANPNMGDGVALFHATHGNLAGTGATIDLSTLAAARKAMRVQKGLDKKDFLNLTPSFLIVGPNLEQVALQYMSSAYNPTVPGQINTLAGSMKVIVEPRITGNEWYAVSAPGMIDTIEHAYLEGDGGLYTETKQGFEVDGVQVKARMTFGAKAIDFRGMYKNAGA